MSETKAGSEDQRKASETKRPSDQRIKRGREEHQAERRHANAENQRFTDHMLPGYKKRRLPVAAQKLVDKAVMDDGLARAPADDARWAMLYDDVQRLVQEERLTTDITPTLDKETTREGDDGDGEGELRDDHLWANGSPCRERMIALTDVSPTLDASPSSHGQAHQRCLLPNHAISEAVHAYISDAFTHQRGDFVKSITSESWDPAALAAMSMVVEEMAKSQARFNAQRTMFAKSPRNQALAAKREAHRQRDEHKERMIDEE